MDLIPNSLFSLVYQTDFVLYNKSTVNLSEPMMRHLEPVPSCKHPYSDAIL